MGARQPSDYVKGCLRGLPQFSWAYSLITRTAFEAVSDLGARDLQYYLYGSCGFPGLHFSGFLHGALRSVAYQPLRLVRVDAARQFSTDSLFHKSRFCARKVALGLQDSLVVASHEQKRNSKMTSPGSHLANLSARLAIDIVIEPYAALGVIEEGALGSSHGMRADEEGAAEGPVHARKPVVCPLRAFISGGRMQILPPHVRAAAVAVVDQNLAGPACERPFYGGVHIPGQQFLTLSILRCAWYGLLVAPDARNAFHIGHDVDFHFQSPRR